MSFHRLNLVRLEGDTFDTTTVSGPPEVVAGPYVRAEFTSGEVSVSVHWPLERYRNADFRIGDVIYVDLPEPEGDR